MRRNNKKVESEKKEVAVKQEKPKKKHLNI